MNIRNEPNAIPAMESVLAFLRDILYSDDPRVPEGLAAALTDLLSGQTLTDNINNFVNDMHIYNIRDFAQALRMGRFRGYRHLLSGIECLIEILEEACGSSPDVPKMIHAAAHILRKQWQDIDILLMFAERKIGFH